MKRLGQWLYRALLSEKFRADITKLRWLWDKNKPDCRRALLKEFLLNPKALRHRYWEERKFAESLQSRWKPNGR